MYYWLWQSLWLCKSLQSCQTLCDPIDVSPPGSPIPGILQARTLKWVAISFSNAWRRKVKIKLFSRVWVLAIPWTAAYQAPPSMRFSRQEYWSEVPLPSLFDCVHNHKLWKILKEMGIPDHLTSLLRNLYEGQEATVRTGHGTMDWLQIGKGVCQGYILSPSLFNLHAEYIMRNAGLDEAQVGIKISRRNINLRYADDTTLMAESEEELKNFLMKVKQESEKVC